MAKDARENTPSTKNIRDAVRGIEDCMADLKSESGSYMNRCRRIRERIASIYDIARDQGIPKKELRALIRKRDLERKVEACRADLEKDEQDTFDMIEDKLGDFANTPLGAAAVERARKRWGRASAKGEKTDTGKAAEPKSEPKEPPSKTGNGDATLDSLTQH